ncbi:unannotated protein [freshwater metagenome]|uniref:Unannotated protein n=1 Tax=freshwater metagenome TaxID=449393 RepID=A0A6J7UN05_9ZZZZ
MLSGVPSSPVGAPGGEAGTTSFDGDEYSPVPAAFTAATWNVTATPSGNFDTCTEVVVEVPSSNVVQTFAAHD